MSKDQVYHDSVAYLFENVNFMDLWSYDELVGIMHYEGELSPILLGKDPYI